MIFAGRPEVLITLDEAAAAFIAAVVLDIQVIERSKLTVDGYPGLAVELKGRAEGENYVVRAIFTRPSDTHFFVMVGVAPADRWQNELMPWFEDMLASITLSEPE